MTKLVCALASLNFVLALCVFACGPAVHPAEGPGTEYPCGIHGRVCGGGMCCADTEVCGGYDAAGFSRCPAGYCCDEGEDWPNVSGRQRPQKKW